MASVVSTLREHLEAIRDRHYRTKYDECGWCCGGFPCPNYTDAMAALAILDESERERNESRDPSNRYPLDRVLIDDPPVSS